MQASANSLLRLDVRQSIFTDRHGIRAASIGSPPQDLQMATRGADIEPIISREDEVPEHFYGLDDEDATQANGNGFGEGEGYYIPMNKPPAKKKPKANVAERVINAEEKARKQSRELQMDNPIYGTHSELTTLDKTEQRQRRSSKAHMPVEMEKMVGSIRKTSLIPEFKFLEKYSPTNSPPSHDISTKDTPRSLMISGAMKDNVGYDINDTSTFRPPAVLLDDRETERMRSGHIGDDVIGGENALETTGVCSPSVARDEPEQPLLSTRVPTGNDNAEQTWVPEDIASPGFTDQDLGDFESFDSSLSGEETSAHVTTSTTAHAQRQNTQRQYIGDFMPRFGQSDNNKRTNSPCMVILIFMAALILAGILAGIFLVTAHFGEPMIRLSKGHPVDLDDISVLNDVKGATISVQKHIPDLIYDAALEDKYSRKYRLESFQISRQMDNLVEEYTDPVLQRYFLYSRVIRFRRSDPSGGTMADMEVALRKGAPEEIIRQIVQLITP